MAYTQSELDIVFRYKPELRKDLEKQPAPSLDSIIVEFLEQYEVFIKPVSTNSKKPLMDSAIAGGLAGIAPIAGIGAAGIQGLQKNSSIQEWTQWKQWALDHKEFDQFKKDKLELVEIKNKKVEELLESAEIKQLIEDLLSQEKKKNTQKEEMNFVYVKVFFGCLFLIACFNSVKQFIYTNRRPTYVNSSARLNFESELKKHSESVAYEMNGSIENPIVFQTTTSPLLAWKVLYDIVDPSLDTNDSYASNIAKTALGLIHSVQKS